VTSAVVASRMGDAPTPAQSQAAYNTAFLIVGAGLVGAVLIGLRLPRRTNERVPAERGGVDAETAVLSPD
jgi:hypothetical protein